MRKGYKMTTKRMSITDIKSATRKMVMHKQFTRLALVAQVPRVNIMLTGGAGSGKSHAARQVSEVMGIPFYYLGMTLMPSNLIGYANPHSGEWVHTPFTRAFIEGGVIVLEEMDGWSPNATLAANAPLANGYITSPTGEMFDRHPDCVVIACANTHGSGATMEYVGRNKLDGAFLDRFAVRINWEYDQRLERQMVGPKNRDIADFVQICRGNADKAKLKVLITPRATASIVAMMDVGFDLRTAAEMSFLAPLDDMQKAVVLDGASEYFEDFEDDAINAVFGAAARRT